MLVSDRRVALLLVALPLSALGAVSGCSSGDGDGAPRPFASAVTEGPSETSIARPGECGLGAEVAPDRCAGKEDGVYCSLLQDYAAYECKGGQILKGLQCATGKCLGADLGGNVQCGERSEDASKQGVMGAAPPGPKDPLTTYAEECQTDVGLMPAFDCMDFEEIPTTQDGSVLSVRRGAKGLEVVRADGRPITRATDPRTGGATDQPRCDEPSWASTPCWPGTRIGVVDGANGSKWAVLCRRQSLQLGTDPNFQLVGVIAHNQKTGGTCFFDKAGSRAPASATTTFDKANFPQPGSSTARLSRDAQLTWLAPAGERNAADPTAPAFENCVACHAAGPFIRSSYIPAALRRTLTNAMDPTGDYKILGTVFRREWAATNPRELAPPGASCSDGCHRIATPLQARMFAHITIGGPELDDKASDTRLAVDGTTRQPTRWPLGYFMPPGSRRAASLAAWTRDNGADQTAMLACLRDPGAKGCTQTAFVSGL